MELVAGERSWRIVFTHRVLLDIEALTGADAMRFNLMQLSARFLRGVLFAVLREAGAPFTIEQIGEMFKPGAFAKIRSRLAEAWIASLPEPEPEPEPDRWNEPAPRQPLSTLDAWAKARFDLRLSDEEWLAMTPRMLHALAKRQLEAIRQRELMLAVLCAHTVNSSFHAPKTATQPASYMLHPWPVAPLQPVTGEMVLAAFAGAAVSTKVN